MQNSIENTINAKYCLDKYEVNLEQKKIQHKYSPILHRTAEIIRQVKNSDKDYLDFKSYSDKRIFGHQIQPYDFYEALLNYDEIIKESKFVGKQQRDIREKIVPYSTGYKIPALHRVYKKILKAENPYQQFYDSLLYRPFFYAIDYFLSNLRDFKEFSNFKTIKLKQKEKKFYFKTTWTLLEIMFNPLLSDNEKQIILNKQYTTCDSLKHSTEMTKMILNKNNIYEEFVPKDIQKFLIAEHRKRSSTHPKRLENLNKIK